MPPTLSTHESRPLNTRPQHTTLTRTPPFSEMECELGGGCGGGDCSMRGSMYSLIASSSSGTAWTALDIAVPPPTNPHFFGKTETFVKLYKKTWASYKCKCNSTK
jgi:hypothetical protein